MAEYKTLKPSTHYIFWSFVTVFFVGAVFLLKAVLLPFVVGIVVAYMLNPAVGKLGKIGISREPASLLILSGFLVVILAVIAIISPFLVRELSYFIKDVPGYVEEIKKLVLPFQKLLEKYSGSEMENLDFKGFLIDNSKTTTSIAGVLADKLAAGGKTIIDIISFLFFMPIVAYFMMKEWPSILRWAKDLIPHHAKDDVMDLLKQIDNKLSGFIRGQISVALFLALAYAIALTLAGLKYGLLIGIMSGLISVIPMVGSSIGLIVSVAVAWFQTEEWPYVLMIGGIFIGGQLIEGNILTPKLVGDSVGLHPLWVFFSLLAGGSLLGILGIFLAVPVAAIIGVLLSFVLYKYRQSDYHHGVSQKVESPQKEVQKSKK